MMIWVGAALLMAGCAGGGTTGGVVLGPNPQSSVSPTGSPQASAPRSQAAHPAAAPAAHSLAAVTSWTEPTGLPTATPSAMLAALTSQTAPLLILDPAVVDAAAGADVKTKPLALLHQGGSRRVLALLDIGEIVKTNPLWQTSWVDAQGKLTPAAPAWLGPGDPKTPDTYPVQYWNAAWQAQAETTLDRLLADGYDGVCLQGVGDYARFAKSRPTAGADMAAFVEALAAHARKADPKFSVLTDGGAGLPQARAAAQSDLYLATVDGVLAHDVFYPGDQPTDNTLAPDETLVSALDTFRKAGDAVFVTERLTDPDKIADFLARARTKGYVPDAALAPPAAPVPAPAAPPSPKIADDH